MRLLTIVCATAALAACATAGSDYARVAAALHQARAEIAPPLGATTYTLDSRRLLDQPGDENRSLAQSLGQLPGSWPHPGPWTWPASCPPQRWSEEQLSGFSRDTSITCSST